MPIEKGPIFAAGDVYIDYPFEEVMFRWDRAEEKIYRRFYGSREDGPVSHDNRLCNDALLYGEQISREVYLKGKARSG